jgi:hypothetical protein
MGWHSRFFAAIEPSWLAQWIVSHPIDKTDLHPFRLVHFLSVAVIVLRFVPREWDGWQAPGFRHAILYGQHSLEIFCVGVLLSFAAHVLLFEWAHGIVAEIVISASGILSMVCLASLMAWYQGLETARRDLSPIAGAMMPLTPEGQRISRISGGAL